MVSQCFFQERKVCYGKWGEGDYATGKPNGGYQCKSKKQISGQRLSSEGRPAQQVHFLGVAPLTCRVDTKSRLEMMQIITQFLPF